MSGNSDYEGAPNLRRRTTDEGNIWKPGDIVNSTPVTVSKPVETIDQKVYIIPENQKISVIKEVLNKRKDFDSILIFTSTTSAAR